MPPPLHQIQKFNEKPRNVNCQDFCITKRNGNCIDYCEVSGFIYITMSCNAKCYDFLTQMLTSKIS